VNEAGGWIWIDREVVIKGFRVKAPEINGQGLRGVVTFNPPLAVADVGIIEAMAAVKLADCTP